MSGETLQIVHIPHGFDYPYTQVACERTPRYPAAGEPVRLQATLSGEPDEVTLQWSLDGVCGQDLTAGWQAPLWSQAGCWVAALAPFVAGQEVRYRWVARAGEHLTMTDWFAFSVLHWDYPQAVLSAQAEGATLRLSLAPGVGPASPVLQLRALVGGVMRADLSFDSVSETSAWTAVNAEPESADAVWRPQGETWELSTADYQIQVSSKPFGLRVLDASGKVLLRDYGPEAIRWLVDRGGAIHRLEWAFHTPPEEQFWGGGERFDRLARRGTSWENTVFNQYCDQNDRSYIPVPFLISSSGYGLYVDTAHVGRFDVGASAADRLLLSFDGGDQPGAQLTWYMVIGPSPISVVQRFTDLVGKPALPPRWAFGPWMSANSWDRQHIVEQEARLTLDLDIPATVLVIEAWSDEITFCMFNDAEYEPVANGGPVPYRSFNFPADGRWPDPKGMVEALQQQGMRVVLWQIPVWKQDPTIPSRQKDLDEAFLIEKGYVVRNEDGSPYRISDGWFGSSLLIDFTSPEATAWWQERRRYLLEQIGVDGFKTDGGEFVFARDLRFADGSRGAEGRNRYAQQYVDAAYKLVQQVRKGDGLTFSRAGYTGAQRSPMHWAGDEHSTFAAFRSSLIAGLNAGVSGISFWGWDLAGFSGDIPSAELFLRATAMACFCPVMQYHSETKAEPSQERTPWNMAARTNRPDVLFGYRFYAHLRMNLMPYLYGQARRSSLTGIPMMRPLWLTHPSDQATWSMVDQYLLGDDLLVAPILEPAVTSRRVYLPVGRWYDFWTQQPHTGPGWVEAAAPADRIPVFVREGAALPLELAVGKALGEGMGNREQSFRHQVVRLYPPVQPTFVLSWNDGEQEVLLSGEWQGDSLSLELPTLPYPVTYEVVQPDGSMSLWR